MGTLTALLAAGLLTASFALALPATAGNKPPYQCTANMLSITVEPAATSTSITWVWDLDFSYYRVSLDQGPQKSVYTKSFTVSGIVPGSTHTLEVWGINACGNVGGYGENTVTAPVHGGAPLA